MATIIDSITLPDISPLDDQPDNPIELTAWSLAKVAVTRSQRVASIQNDSQPKRLLQLRPIPKHSRKERQRLDLSRIQNVEAVIIFIYGDEPAEPYRIQSGTCANCAYSSRARQCSFHHTYQAQQEDRQLTTDTLRTITAEQWRAIGGALSQWSEAQAQKAERRSDHTGT
ncbi:Uncharacterized protein TPAR_04122 [Tolypocladium paradoxum]|uniref:Uncharacterized protein n=1 Tax=Tolypocladium paradoxum TaxID=94208 RepID=A0A2S4KZS8_9HYPO|nr:Uncharacterized protein TPAR_04122 [Tolypocladium paradoxum]